MTACRVLITGATGVIGPAVVDAFSAAGWAVRAFVRVRPGAAAWSAPAALEVGRLDDVASLERAMQDVQVVIHLAAKLHVNVPTESDLAAYRAVNVEGTRHVVVAARRAGARVIFASTIAVYGPTHGREVDEESPPLPETPYARSKLDAETLVLNESNGGGSGTVLRLGAIYGPRMKGNYLRLVRALAGPWFLPIGPGTNRRSLIHEDDVGRAFLAAASHPELSGRAYNVTDGAVHRMRDIVAAISAALGRPAPRFALPAAPVRFACRTADAAARLAGRRAPVTPEALDKWLEDLAVSSTRARSELGFVPAVLLPDGWRRTVDALRRTGAL